MAATRGGVRGGLLVVAAAVVSAATVWGVTRGGSDGAVANATPTSASSSSASAPSPPAPVLRSPLTGLPVKALSPVLAVKIDNVRPARPPAGLTEADVVYVEPVEGGLSRILAVFSGRIPRTVGPVRSARESDLELLRQYGEPAFAFSGANTSVLPQIAAASLTDVSPRRAGSAYRRDRTRSAPHNLYADPRALLARAPKATAARDVGFRFGPAPAGGVPVTKDVAVRYDAATTGFAWSSARRQWEVSMDGRAATGADGTRLAASTVVVQYVSITASQLRDSTGSVTPYSHTVGSGRALVLRDGLTFDARWSRPSESVGTTFTTADGAPLAFAPGQVWVVLAKAATPR